MAAIQLIVHAEASTAATAVLPSSAFSTVSAISTQALTAKRAAAM